MDEQPPQGPTVFESSTAFSTEPLRAVAVYCSDGRFGLQFDEFLQDHLRLSRYDRLVIPGGPACLAAHFSTFREEEAAVEELRFLVEAHELESVILIAHQNCAFYTQRLQTPELQLESQQREDIQKAISRVPAISSNLEVQAFFARVHDDGTVRFEVIS
jgi:hypothetical protein